MQDKKWEKLIKELTIEEITKVLSELGSAPPKNDNDGNYLFQSVCHNSNSWKLCYYPETKTFFCYRDWERFNIFSLVMRTCNIDFAEAYKFVCTLLNKDLSGKIEFDGFSSNYVKSDWDIFDKFSRLEEKTTEDKNVIEIYPKDLLNLYVDKYYQGWIEEHIEIPAMEKYQIKYDIPYNRIIIPHFDIHNNLIGIRCRNLSSYNDIKYCPVSIENKIYSHPLSENLYGLNFNKGNIKKLKKVMIVESEKSVLQAESYFPDHSFVVACCGSNISYRQIEILLELGVTEVILGMDWDFKDINLNDEEYKEYKKKIMKLSKKLIPYFTVEVLFPTKDPFIYKCSPTDLGKEYLLNSMKSKLTIDYDIICNELERKEE